MEQPGRQPVVVALRGTPRVAVTNFARQSRTRPASRLPRIRGDTWLRRASDVAVAAVGLVCLSPILLAIALAVRLESSGPALYRQERVGRRSCVFRLVKFRSMVDHADRLGALVSGRCDCRITRVGRLLRRSKLDELPQLWNVLVGDMTLVGPRPEVSRFLCHYTERERLLLTVRPGLAGPGQLFFTLEQAAELDDAMDPERHYVQSQLHHKLAVDLDYLACRSLKVDLWVLVRTAAMCLTLR
jgi:lipopolysaccharide/colanic/teichoic acid biosynthesis glycosyltransferase